MAVIELGQRGQRDVAGPNEGAAPDFVVDELFWGYVIRNTARPPMGMVIGQVLAGIAGILVTTMAVTLVFGPAMLGEWPGGLRVGAAVMLAALATILFWFASRGAVSEVQIDTRQGELREVTRHRAGRPTVGACHGFDSIGGILIDRSAMRDDARGRAMLVVRVGNTAEVLPVASGTIADLEPLRDRLGRDMMVRPRQAIVTPAQAA